MTENTAKEVGGCYSKDKTTFELPLNFGGYTLTYKCGVGKTAAEIAAAKTAALKAKWLSKDCSAETVAANKTECEAAQAGATAIAATFMTAATFAAML